VWHSVHGQEQESTYLHGSGSDAEATASKKYGRAHEQHLQLLFEEVEEDIINSIVGVVPVDPQEYKFFVWLNGCGAFLVAPNVVLSAAHCFSAAQQYITLGMHKITQDLGVGFYMIEHIPIALSAVHPNYNAVTQDNYFWMIRLQWASILYPGNVVPLDTPTDTLVLSSTSGADLVTFGFGTLASGGVTPNVMQEVVVDYISNAACISQPYGYSSSQITPNMMCAGRSGKDSCQGNSGGPILDVNTGKKVGVVSWGF
jgi:trypsin